MARFVNVDNLLDYLRNEVHVSKFAQLIEKYAKNHTEPVIGIGDPLPEGTVVQFYKRDDGSQWARLQTYAAVCGQKAGEQDGALK